MEHDVTMHEAARPSPTPGNGGVTILGGHQTDFATNIAKAGQDVSDLVREAVTGTLADAGIEPDQIESIHVGNVFGQLYNGQGHLGAMPASVIPELWGVPAMRHEAACASASMATLSAMAEIESGRYDCVLVLGAEQERNMPGAQAAAVQTAAAWVGHETEGVQFFWPFAFDRVADEYDARFGLDDAHLARHRRAEPAQREGQPERADARLEAQLRQLRHRRPRQPRRARQATAQRLYADHRRRGRHRAGLGPLARRTRSTRQGPHRRMGHSTVGLGLEQKLAHSADHPFVMPHVRRAITDAFDRAEIAGVEELDLIETHDCMTPSEYMAIDHFGITPPGESWKAIERGDLERDGRIPINPSGGLIGGGHPVGATGARMLLDATKQVSGTAGGYQVDGARRAATLNIGGSTATTACFVVEAV